METRKNKKLGLILAALTALNLMGSPGAWAKHKVKYIYYPASQVYYNPVGRQYYYMDNGAWVDRTVAPVGISLGKGVSINLGGTVPYTYHTEVIREYPTTYIVR